MAGGIIIYTLATQLLWRTGFFELRFVWTLLLTASLGLSSRCTFFKLPAYSVGTRVRMRHAFLQGWLVFSVLFWYWAVIRSANPGVTHTEQSMDVMWMGAALASGQAPLQDAWFSGAASSYYADGHQILAFLGLKLGLPLQVSVNITQIIWFALSGLLAFEAGKSLMRLQSKTGETLAGILSIIFVCFVSTPKGFLDALTKNTWWWWWDASRVIKDGETQLITEFPFFSFWLGDNHAHLIGLPFLLLTIVVGTGLIRSRRISFATALLPVLCVVWSWRINPWQTPTALAILGLGLLLRKRKLQISDVKYLSFAAAITLLFWFPIRASGPELSLEWTTFGETGLLGFLNVFGFLVPGVVWLGFTRPHRLWIAFAILFLGMFMCAEVVYLQDVFQNRMNTVFKVYYQLWVLLALLSALGFAQAMKGRRRTRILAISSLALCLVPGVMYAGKLSLESRKTNQRSMNAWDVLPEETKFFLEISQRLIVSGERIVEAPGSSYDSNTSMLGTWTMGNTLIGWTGHQAQWRPGQSSPSLGGVYEASTLDELRTKLLQLEADWVLVGPNERKAFKSHPQFEQWMDELAYRVVDQADMKLFRVR